MNQLHSEGQFLGQSKRLLALWDMNVIKAAKVCGKWNSSSCCQEVTGKYHHTETCAVNRSGWACSWEMLSSLIARMNWVWATKYRPAKTSATSPPAFVQLWVIAIPGGTCGPNAGFAPAVAAALQWLQLSFHCPWVLAVITALVTRWGDIAKVLRYGSMATSRKQKRKRCGNYFYWQELHPPNARCLLIKTWIFFFAGNAYSSRNYSNLSPGAELGFCSWHLA